MRSLPFDARTVSTGYDSQAQVFFVNDNPRQERIPNSFPDVKCQKESVFNATIRKHLQKNV